VFFINYRQNHFTSISIYIKAKRADFLCTFVCVLLGDGCYTAGAFSFWSVLGLFLGNDLLLGNDNNGVVFSLGSVSRVYFFATTSALTTKQNERR
jgi:hypothetical protein